MSTNYDKLKRYSNGTAGYDIRRRSNTESQIYIQRIREISVEICSSNSNVL